MLENFTKTEFGKTLEEYFISEIVNSEEQPIALAPYPINKSQMGILTKVHTEAVNTSEIERIVEACRTHSKVFAETGSNHFSQQKTVIEDTLIKSINKL